MVRKALLRAALALSVLLVPGQQESLAWERSTAANIFAERVRPAAQEPRPLSREHRTIVLKSLSWAKDVLDETLPWLDVDLMIEAGDVTSYFEGVEVQYEMRKILVDTPCSQSLIPTAFTTIPLAHEAERLAKEACWQARYEVALTTAKEKIAQGQRQNASHWVPVKFESPGDYVAVFDADETLLTQWFNPKKTNPNFRESFFSDGLKDVPADSVGGKRSGSFVRFAPGAEEALLGLHADPHCKGIVLFSEKDDDALQHIYENWKSRREGLLVRDKRENGKPLISGVFSRSHLTMSGDPKFGGVARIPSKNLRIFDPRLQHVVIVDDDPSRIIPEQQYLLRAQPKFDSRRFLESESEKSLGVKRVWKYYNRILEQTAEEIFESSLRAEGDKRAKVNARKGELDKMPFSQAFRPYSFLGRRVFDALRYSIPREDDDLPTRVLRGMTIRTKISGGRLEREALETARTNMPLYEAAFDSQ